MLYVGLALALAASALYVRTGLRELRASVAVHSLKLSLTFWSILMASLLAARKFSV